MVYEDILITEAKERSMLLWLRNLRIHSFEPRHFENISPQHLDNVIRIPSLNSRNSVEGQTVHNTLNIEEKQSKTICDEGVKQDDQLTEIGSCWTAKMRMKIRSKRESCGELPEQRIAHE